MRVKEGGRDWDTEEDGGGGLGEKNGKKGARCKRASESE